MASLMGFTMLGDLVEYKSISAVKNYLFLDFDGEVSQDLWSYEYGVIARRTPVQPYTINIIPFLPHE